MNPEVVFAPEAEEQLVDLYRYITTAGSPEAADRYTDSIVAFCEELALFPHRGKTRDDIRPGLRTIGFRRRVVVAFVVLEQTLVIVGIFYGGRDYAAILAGPED
ncbi:MAG: type II toxin-antitoxin system RelE/ParE family toxin [Mycobacterium sp.]|nr:type II toxin-antitoxin system RelE/ParE family toxin [Mycobacterium sp.]